MMAAKGMMRTNLDVERSDVYPQQPNLTRPLSQSLLLAVASVGTRREKEIKLVKQEKRPFYLGHAAVNSILAFGASGCFRGIC